MYKGNIPMDCASSIADRIITFEVRDTIALNEFVNITTVVLPTVTNGSYYFQLQDLSSTICILGPDLFGNRVPFVNYIAPPFRLTPNTTYPPSSDFNSPSWFQQSMFLIITFIILVACTAIGLIIYFRRREQKSYFSYYANEIPTFPSADTIIRVQTEPELTRFAKQLIDGNVQCEGSDSNSYVSATSGGARTDSASFVSAESRIRISSSYGSMSFKTADDYNDSEDDSASLNIDDLFIEDDQASTVTIKAE
jgi:hypothetical protein